ncbi:MAG TPA: DUF2461 domain-containing protein [Bacteroidia bacterium]|jgi:uncharacterized protein (TIGR02453 family)|nr:DUF2461 domain-containing protein [Bacteroidia bacterium]
MESFAVKKESFKFLKELSENNNRDWFNANKDRYIQAHENIINFANKLLIEMNKHDKIENTTGKESLFRIYKDIRFSKDKTPYSCRWSGGFQRATKKLRGGYYFHLEPGKSFLAGGFWGPEPADIQRIRQDIALNYKDWKKMLADKTLVKTFGGIIGDKVATSPKGYSKDDPAIELLRYKQYILKHPFTDKEVLTPDFVNTVNDTFKKMRPFLNYMSDVLTTDANGVSTI